MVRVSFTTGAVRLAILATAGLLVVNVIICLFKAQLVRTKPTEK